MWLRSLPLSFCVLALGGSLAWAQHLPDQLKALRSKGPGTPRLHFGYKVIDANTGETLAAENNSELFTPASNNKLYTTAFALMKLGPDYRFTTELRAPGADALHASVLSALQLVGGGDPSMSGRASPYSANSADGDPLAAVHTFADQLRQRGVSSINGDVTAVATRYAEQPYPDGWAVEDIPYGYSAPVSSLFVTDGTIMLLVHPTENGELADIQLRPAIPHFVLLNQVRTVAAGKTELQVMRPLGSNEVVLAGTVLAGAADLKAELAVEDPALFAAECLRDAAADQGIAIRGEATAEYRGPFDTLAPELTGTILATHQSESLSELVKVTNKVSQNLYAEVLLRESALAVGPAADPLAERQKFLDSIGITRDGSGYEASDGSGLARQDKASPDATVALLRFMWTSSLHDVWLASLPIGGVDGTLKSRLKNVAGAERVHAKTGSLGHVNTMSGYLETNHGHWLAFSLMADDTLASDRDVRSFLDTVCAAMLND